MLREAKIPAGSAEIYPIDLLLENPTSIHPLLGTSSMQGGGLKSFLLPRWAAAVSRSWVYWFCESQLSTGCRTKGLSQDIKPDSLSCQLGYSGEGETNWSHSNRCFSCFMNCSIIPGYRYSFCLLEQTCRAVYIELLELNNLAETFRTDQHFHTHTMIPVSLLPHPEKHNTR